MTPLRTKPQHYPLKLSFWNCFENQHKITNKCSGPMTPSEKENTHFFHPRLQNPPCFRVWATYTIQCSFPRAYCPGSFPRTWASVLYSEVCCHVLFQALGSPCSFAKGMLAIGLILFQEPGHANGNKSFPWICHLLGGGSAPIVFAELFPQGLCLFFCDGMLFQAFLDLPDHFQVFGASLFWHLHNEVELASICAPC